MDQKKGKSRIRGIIILVLLAVMLVSGAMSIRSWMEDKRTREEYERLAELARGDHCAAVHGSRDRARDRRAGDRALCISH